MLNNREKFRIILAFISIAVILISFLISGFYPVYLCRDNTIYINNIQYRQDPLTDWYPTGEKYKIGNLCGGVPLLTSLYRYQGDANQVYAAISSIPADAQALPYHRVDMPLPPFSADVIDAVTLSIGSDMTPDNMDNKQITITEKAIIGAMAACFSNPVVKDETKEVVGTTIGLSAQSGLYENIIYKIGFVAYDGNYCLMQADQTLYEIPHQLLETIFGLTIYPSEQYAAIQ